MAGSKWIADLKATTGLPDAARLALTSRLQTVRDYLPRVLDETDADPENVHQLRVGTRRARAALDLFDICLPRRVYKTAKQELRGLRRAAGNARDWDVFLDAVTRWGKEAGAKLQPAVQFLRSHAIARRMEAQTELQALGTDYPEEFDEFLITTIAAVREARDPGHRTLIDLAQPTIRGLVEALESAAGRDLSSYADQHQVRIIGKRLRYAMELFGGCFGPAFRRRLYPAVENMQEILGQANDCAVAGARLEEIITWLTTRLPADARRFGSGFAQLRKDRHRRLQEEQARFAAWWAAWPRLPSSLALRSSIHSPER